MKTNIILLGPPGGGKGTQAKIIQSDFGIIQLSTGDMLRAAIKLGSEIGKKAEKLINSGKLVSDEIVCGLVSDRIDEPDAAKGFIMDGFPRTLPQAEALDRMLTERGMKINSVLEIRVPDDMIVDRIDGRYSCGGCGAGYHDRHHRPKVEGRCDKCGGVDFIRRSDDNAATVRSRLDIYHAETATLLPFYQKKGLLTIVDGTQKIDVVYEHVKNAITKSRAG